MIVAALIISLVINFALLITLIPVLRRIYDVKLKFTTPALFTITADFNKDKTINFFRLRNKAIIRQNNQLKKENNKLGLGFLALILILVFVTAIKDKVKGNKQTNIEQK